MKNFKIKNLPSLFLLLFISFLLLSFSLHISKINNEIDFLYFGATVDQAFLKKEKSITLIFVGDIMLNRGVEWAIQKYGQGDWNFPFLKISSDLREADILFGNLEGPISDKGVKVGSIYSFRNDPKAVEGLKFAGFDILSVANNHIFDYGRAAMEDTFLRLKKAEIDYLGGGFSEIEAYSPIIKEVNGSTGASSESQPNSSGQARIAFLAFTNLGSPYWSAKGNNSGIAWLTKENFEEGIKKAKENADLVIASMHFGDEYKSSSSSEQKYFAHLAIDSGADFVIGHHPHVVQEIEKYKDKYIAYSLGNFIFDQNFSEETMKGLMLKVSIKNAKINEVIPIEIKINGYFQPEIIK